MHGNAQSTCIAVAGITILESRSNLAEENSELPMKRAALTLTER
jgi:hypothetical protein